MNQPRRHFIGNTASAPAQIVAWCREQWPDALPAGLVFCVPTALAFRRLRDALTHAYGAFQGIQFILPAGLLTLFAPESSQPIASPSEVLLVWDRVFTWLQQADADNRIAETLFPGNHDWLERSRARLSIAQRLVRLRKTLAEAKLDFGSVAAHPMTKLAPATELLRWQALDALETRFREEMSRVGLVDPTDHQLAIFAHPQPREQETGTAWRLIVACVPDFMPALESLLTEAPQCDILILDEPEAADDFTEFGLPKPSAWAKRAIDIPAEAIVIGENPLDEAEAIHQKLCARKTIDPADLCLALLNPEVIRPVHALLASHGVTFFEPEPIALNTRPVARLLSEICLLNPTQAPHHLFPLLSAPEVAEAVGSDPATLRTAYNELIEGHQPETILAATIFGRDTALAPFLEACMRWMKAFTDHPVQACRDVLCELYGNRMADPIANPLDFESFKSLRDLFTELETLRIADAVVSPELILARIATLNLSPLRRGADCACEGRLEFIWSPAPLLILAGLNEGVFPDSTFEDAFLPNGFRCDLGLRSDENRAARDAYLLATACKQHRPEDLLLSCSRSSLRGDWLKPSRLYFRCDAATREERARQLFVDSPLPRPTPGAETGLAFKENPIFWEEVAPLKKLSATAIRAFLDSPLTYWLTRRRNLQMTDELPDGVPFNVKGSILHDILAQLPKIQGKTADEILPLLLEALQQRYTAIYGKQPPVEVLAARMSSERQVRAMARLEAKLRTEGWETKYVEKGRASDEDAWRVPVQTPNGNVLLYGQIDRIDYHPVRKLWRIIDYKTTIRSKDASDSHWNKNRAGVITWKDYQLPIYRMILRHACKLPLEKPVELAYVVLSASSRADLSRYEDPICEEQTEAAVRETISQILHLGTEALEADVGAYGDPLLRLLTEPTVPKPEDEEAHA